MKREYKRIVVKFSDDGVTIVDTPKYALLDGPFSKACAEIWGNNVFVRGKNGVATYEIVARDADTGALWLKRIRWRKP